MTCQIICPNLSCRKILKAPDEARGKVVKCKHCSAMLRVPEAKRPALAAAAGSVAGFTFARDPR